ncbi:purine and uridine phosphorylase [Zopfia rhizophila CBS 207.26]|uniref:Purine and uridine phosphorylase n=1 Tax=Zopfia rhizophila CBS 207.26 TaxID=1314779 RepID=A0A6A6DLB9_9PEZI|nr:purine and uridine phosphorylase [Zopfia rhizophila CBS 207.26]
MASFLFNREYLESNGFSGCESMHGENQDLTCYNHWSRFIVKQTHKELQPKSSFTRHHSTGEIGNLLNPNTPIHGPQSIRHGWEWYEMGFFVHWTPPHSTTLLCFDIPGHMRASLRSALSSSIDNIDLSDPYSVFSIIIYELLSLYNDSVWSLRNHICGVEATRPQDPNYPLLHEIARHAIHVSETLSVALESIKALQQQHQDYATQRFQDNNRWNKIRNQFQFQLRFLHGLLLRSESNKARIQNEITLVARYSIGWIAPLPLELTAAKAVLDEDHGDIHVDGYIYHGGEIGKQNIVMAVQSKMGTDAASDLAARMRAAFRNIEYFVVVGIGGGVPSYGPSGAQSQIVLGDVVVSCPRGCYGGVIRYDFGAWTNEDRLEPMSHTNSPPDSLLNAVNVLQARHSTPSGTKIPALLQEMRLNIRVDECQNFEDQGAVQDRLFQNDYLHPEDSANEDCENCCDLSRCQMRQRRGDRAVRRPDTPKIHYGNIGSSNQLQISASKRNQLHEKFGVICFEMEGAGVIQKHPCLVIRGICDYSDSHKNKKWQPYAAATAAAYTKELLEIMPASKSAQSHSAAKQVKQYGKLLILF